MSNKDGANLIIFWIAGISGMWFLTSATGAHDVMNSMGWWLAFFAIIVNDRMMSPFND